MAQSRIEFSGAEGLCKVGPSVIIKGKGRCLVHDYVSIEENVLIDTGASPKSLIEIGARSKIKYGAVLRAYDGFVRIGKRSSVGEYSVLAGHGGLSVGNTVLIAGHCYLSAADHILSGLDAIRFQGETAKGITIGDGAWLGARCVVLDGVTVGAGCVLAAGAVATADTSRSGVYVGAPCRLLRYR